jgi:hypothetical protein
MHLLIDANKLLEFYELPKSQLVELEKLIALVKAGTITLHVTDELADEVRRNRPKVLGQLRKTMSDARLSATLPKSMDQFSEAPAVTDALRVAQTAHSDLLKAFDRSAAARTLQADRLLEQLFATSPAVDTSSVLERARERKERGRRPGKGNHIGDELNWESLLESIPSGRDLHIVTDDPDYRSPLNSDELHEALADEWRARKGAKAQLYRSLEQFTREHFPDIALASDVEKVRHIQALVRSASFAETHSAVARLAKHALFSPAQARQIVEAAATNSQVRWIASDEDVQELLSRIIQAHRDALEPSYVTLLEAEMYPPQQESSGSDFGDEPLPF